MEEQKTWERRDLEWLDECFSGLTTDIVSLTPSQWAEKRRYLPAQITPLPGMYRFDVAPYLREILDCLGEFSPVREVSVKKGVQLGCTVGILENAIGYYIEQVANAPVMLVTADADLAQLRMESYITPMLHYSELTHLIKSADETNNRKRGKTDKKIEWEGGGFLVPFGAQNANKLRSLSIRVLLCDEVDGWPMTVGKDGDPVRLVRARTAAYEARRKILDLSTPSIRGQSKIDELFQRGDQRRFFVRCLGCDLEQVLRWEGTDAATGKRFGMVWETAGDRLVPGSVRYLCPRCQHPHTDDDKAKLFASGEWRPTAVPTAPDIRSYHLSALYSPPGMQTWEHSVRMWLEAWDTEHSRPRDLERMQVFYNNVLGEPFELRGERVRFEMVSEHRRHFYRYGEIKNAALEPICGGPVGVVTCAVDVHGDCLKVAVIGWCRERRAVLLDYQTLLGTPERVDDAPTWGELRRLVEQHEYTADDGKRYRIRLTLIDSGFLTDQVYTFCGDYDRGVHPVKGQAVSPKSVRVAEVTEFENDRGLLAFGITVDLYKDRWSAILRRQWDGLGQQPPGCFNAPINVTDKELRELTVESKRPKIDKLTGKRLGYVWHRPSGAPNELWDLLIYNSAALDLLARDWVTSNGEEFMNWAGFWADCEGGLFFE